MIQIKSKDQTYQYDSFHLIKEFCPDQQISQEVCPGQKDALVVEFMEDPKAIREAESSQANSFFCCHAYDKKVQQALVSCREGKERVCFRIAEPDIPDKSKRKRRISCALYQEMKKITGKDLAWGILTGIRPTKIPMKLIEEGKTPEEASRMMQEVSLVSKEKADLAAAIAVRERKLLSELDYENGYSLYAGIPFCPTICAYCSFSSYPLGVWEKRMDEYLDALLKEISYVAEHAKDQVLNTIYIGGGTPTTLLAGQLDRLLTHLERSFSFKELKEFTVEAGRPDSITKEKLLILKEHGIGRISINPQTMQQKTLDAIGRYHSVDEVIRAFYMARELGFDNINMDLIVGLPGETLADVEDTLEKIGRLDPDSITVHSLAIKRAAREKLKKVTAHVPKVPEATAEMIEAAGRKAHELGAEPYYLYRQKNIAGNFENVGYAKVDKAGIYNILIMEEMQTIVAVGAGASTKAVFPKENRIERIENVKDVDHYINRIDEMMKRKGELLWH